MTEPVCSKDKLCPSKDQFCVHGQNICMDKDPWCIVLDSIDGPGIRSCGFSPCDFEKYPLDENTDKGGCEGEYVCTNHKSFPAGGLCLPRALNVPGQQEMPMTNWLSVDNPKDNCNYACPDDKDDTCVLCPQTW